MILCAGEALIDMLPHDTGGPTSAFLPVSGGALLNSARALGRLGAPAGFYCALSDDMFGAQLREDLANSGVDTALCPSVPRPCTLAFVTLVDGQARYAFYDENTALSGMEPADLPSDLSGVSALLMGGISLVSERAGAVFETLPKQLPADSVTMLDPNIRPGFIRDETAYRARLNRLIAQSDILKLSDEDLHWLEGPGAPADLARGLLSRGPRLVLLTEGARGASAHHAEGHLTVSARPVQVVDTVGAGDTFNAGFLAGLHDAGQLSRAALDAPDEDALEAALRLGTRAAAITVSRAGANPPTRAELEGS